MATRRFKIRPIHRPDVLTAGDAAELLQVHPDTVRALAASGELPGRRLGRRWRFHRVALMHWLAVTSPDADPPAALPDASQAPVPVRPSRQRMRW